MASQFWNRFQARSQNCWKQLLALSCLSVWPYVRTVQLSFHWMDFQEIWSIWIFPKIIRENPSHETRTRITVNEYLRRFTIIFRWILSKMWNVLDKCCWTNENTYLITSWSRVLLEKLRVCSYSRNVITRTILGEEYRSLSSSLWSFLHSPVTSSLLGRNIERMKIHTLISRMFLWKSFRFKMMWKNIVEQYNMAHALCMMDN
jgi:hypothetical protein